MKKIRLLAILLLGITLLSQCRREPNTVQGQIFGTPAPLMVPDGFPSPIIPKDNPMSPLLAVWTPNILFCIIGAYLYKIAPK